jgi:hypothetical protein
MGDYQPVQELTEYTYLLLYSLLLGHDQLLNHANVIVP